MAPRLTKDALELISKIYDQKLCGGKGILSATALPRGQAVIKYRAKLPRGNIITEKKVIGPNFDFKTRHNPES